MTLGCELDDFYSISVVKRTPKGCELDIISTFEDWKLSTSIYDEVQKVDGFKQYLTEDAKTFSDRPSLMVNVVKEEVNIREDNPAQTEEAKELSEFKVDTVSAASVRELGSCSQKCQLYLSTIPKSI